MIFVFIGGIILGVVLATIFILISDNTDSYGNPLEHYKKGRK